MTRNSFPTESPAVVTCGLPYANGDLHIGHLRTYVGGDVFARALRTLGQEVAFVCGSDMHGTPIAVQAIEDGIDPEEFALRWHEQYQETFPEFGIEFDNYGHTHDETNRGLTMDIVESLEEAGYVYEKEIKVGWDAQAEQPLPDRYVKGQCPHCGSMARGDECDEGCGRHLEPGEIRNPVSTITGNQAEYRKRNHRFFRVSDLESYLTSFLDRVEGTENAQNQPRQWIDDGLQDWCITRDLDWGFDYPGDDDVVLYVWVDAPIEYIASTKQYTTRVGADEFDWERAWKTDGEIVHIIGRDIIQHHTIFWPAMLQVAGFTEPRAVVASGFMSLDGEAFSTSRNRAIWAREYLEEGLHPDLLRYYLTTVGGFQNDIDFSWERFKERVNNELVGTVGNFAYRSLLFAYRNFDGTPNAPLSEPVQDRIEQATNDFRTAVNDFSTRGATTAALELANYGNQYIQAQEPWNQPENEAATVIRDCVQLTKAIAILLSPTVPNTAAKLWEQLGEAGTVADAQLEEALIEPPTQFGEPEELFDPIPSERVAELEHKLDQRVEEQTEEPDRELEPLKTERIPIETFEELDLRVGEIIDCEPIPDSEDLVRVDVDIGVEERTVVAGLQDDHDITTLPGTQTVILANLQRAEVCGVESDGMLLATEQDTSLLTVATDAVPGDKII